MATHQATCIDHGRAGDRDGYCNTWHNGGKIGRHRLVYAAHVGVELDALRGKIVRHVCDNPRCINPEHLVLGTHADNMKDKVDRGRSALPTLRHLLPEDVRYIRKVYKPGTRWHPSPTGQRQLAAHYGVPQAVIRQIVNNLTYKDITNV